MRQALLGAVGLIVLVAAVGAPAHLISGALAAEGEHGGSHETSSSSQSGEKPGGGGGVGSTLNKVTCGAQNVVNRVTLGFFGSSCSSSSGGVDPVQATSSILKQTFGGLAVAASPLLTGTLTQVPDYSSQSGGVISLERSTTAIGFAVAALVLTLSILRFTLAGMAASGGFEGAEGVIRTLAAALAMVAWPWAFHKLAALMNTVTHAMLSTHAVHVALVALVAVGGLGAVLFATASKIGWIFGIVILGLEAILMIGLLLMKVLLAGATTVIFVAMPLALALWPLRETSWIAGRMARVLFLAVATPLIWALIFATAAVMGGSVFGLTGGFWGTILIRPLAAMSMFVLALLAPLILLRHAHGGVGHPVGRLSGYMTMRLATGAVSAHLPERLGGRRAEPTMPTGDSQITGVLATEPIIGRPSPAEPINSDTAGAVEAFLAGIPNQRTSGAVADGASGVPDDARCGRREVPPAVAATAAARELSGVARSSADASTFALKDPSTLSFADSLAAERLKGRVGHTPPTAAEARAALDGFSPHMQQRIRDQSRGGSPVSEGSAGPDGAAFRSTMAASALGDDISERQAEALTVLAGIDDDSLRELFSGLGPAHSVPAPLPTGTGGEQIPSSPARAGGRREVVPAAGLRSFEDALAETRQAPLIVEQPALPPGRE